MHRIKNVIINSLLVVSSIVIVLSITELILRSAHIIPVAKTISNFEKGVAITDPVLGWRLAPNKRTIMTDGYFKEELVTNQDGLRDLFDGTYANPGLIAIGDSYTFGDGVAMKDTWPEQLQTRLKVNVINAGVFGYSPWQYKYVIQELYKKGYPIKLVLYALPLNDTQSTESSTVVSNSLDEPGELSAYFEDPLRNLALANLCYSSAARIYSLLHLQSDPLYDRRFVENISQAQTELLATNKFLEGIGARLLIVYIGDLTFAMTDKWELHQRRHRYSRTIVQDHFSGWSREKGIIFEDAVPALEQAYLRSGKRRTSIALDVDNHYNANAYSIIANVFYDALVQNHLIE